MSKGTRVVLGVFVAYLALAFAHAYLNIGLDKFNFRRARAEQTFRVGFLPVT